ncbi:hypothetical protein A2U01_0110659, partial [Trifolium medium]|nr:hypothetical protein [Trifolium medium]
VGYRDRPSSRAIRSRAEKKDDFTEAAMPLPSSVHGEMETGSTALPAT